MQIRSVFTKKWYIYFFFVLLLFSDSFLRNSSDNPYVEIDQHADATSPRLKVSIPVLVRYLIEPAKNDFEKVRAIFRWITQNISYDVDAFLNERLRIEDPKRVINRGKAVCGGYSVLFKVMCQEAGIKSYIVTGWSKGYREKVPSQPNHAWNVVTINQKYFLLDVTWGSGYIDEQLQYNKKFNDHYFLTDPKIFIYDHFPEDEFWQLSSNPISRSDFKNLILLRPAFFQTGLELISHKTSQIVLEDTLLIKIQAPENTYISAQLLLKENALDDHFIFIQKKGDIYELNVHFPDKGDYTLRIYSKVGNKLNESYTWACDYKITVLKNAASSPFVKQYAMYENLNSYLYQPTALILKKNEEQHFRIKIADVLGVSVLQEQKLFPFTKDGSEYSGNIFLNADTVILLAQTDTSGYYHYLLEYLTE